MTRRRTWGKAVILGAAAMLASFVNQPHAEAHAAGNTPSSNYVSRVLTVTPTTTTLSASVIEAGNRLEVQWRSGPELLIEDYDGHPYLRVGPDGAFENRQSNAVYLNADRKGGTLVPEGLRPDGPPEWRKISSDRIVRFHDHRVHWMGDAPPPQVRAAKGRTHLIQTWVVPITQGTNAFVIGGDLRWVPGPTPVVPLAVAGLAGLLLVAAVVALAKRGRMFSALTAFSALLGTLVAVDAVHLFGIAFGVRGGSGLGRVVSIGWVSLIAWAFALATIVVLARRRIDGLYVGVFAAGIITLVGGLSDVSILSSTSVPFAFSTGIARASIALTLGLGIATIIAGVILTGTAGSPTNRGAESVTETTDNSVSPPPRS